jgi:hypothetical protein
MATANSLIKKIAKAMAKYNVTDRAVYKRVQTRTGGDPLTGRGVVVTHIDTLLSPQPVVSAIGTAPLVGTSSTVLAPNGEYRCSVVSSALSRAELAKPELVLVFKDAQGVEELLYVVGFEPAVINGTTVVFDLVLASKKR